LTGPGYQRTTYGFYRRRGGAATTAQRIVDVVAQLPSGALVAGWAAAFVHGADLLDGLDDFTMAPLPVPVLLAPGQRLRSVAGIDYRQSTRRAPGRIVEGIPVTSVQRSALDIALLAHDLTEAVVGLDAVLGSGRLPYERLQRARIPPRRGACQARRAVELSRVGVASPWESRLRMFAVQQLGWMELKVNSPVFEVGGGLLGLLGVPDPLDAEAGLVLEYDGVRWRGQDGGHRDRAQHRADNEREERLERAGLVVVRVEKADLTGPSSRLRQRLAAARADGLARDRSRDRWTLDEPEHWVGLPA